jgi:hypothetical protein
MGAIPAYGHDRAVRGASERRPAGEAGRGRADCVFTPSGLAKIFGDDAGVASRHWLVAVGVVEQFAQLPAPQGFASRPCDERNTARLTNG